MEGMLNQTFAFIREYPDLHHVITSIPYTIYFLYGAQKQLDMTENMYAQLKLTLGVARHMLIVPSKGPRWLGMAVFGRAEHG